MYESTPKDVQSAEGFLVELEGGSSCACWVTQSVQSPGDAFRSTAEHPDSLTESISTHKETLLDIDMNSELNLLQPNTFYSTHCLFVLPISSNSNFHRGRPTSILDASGRYFSSDMLWQKQRGGNIPILISNITFDMGIRI